MLSSILIILVAVIHIYFFLLESYLYTTAKGKKIFQLNDEKIKHTKVLAFNQGYYNLCFAGGLILGLVLRNEVLIVYLLGSIVLVGIVGALSFSRKVIWLQAFPALITLIIFLLQMKVL